MASKRFTIQDVARQADVGVGTVSRVLNDDPKVKDTTRQHVLSVIDRVGYQPSFTARSLRTQKSGTIGFIADAVATTSYAVDIIKGAQNAAWARGKLLLVVDADNPELRERAFESMVEREVEGVIYAAMFHQKVELPAQFGTLPTVLVDCYSDSGAFPSAVPDEVQGGRTATEELLKKGHKRVAIVTNDRLETGYPAPAGRFAGYKQALENAGIPFDDELFLEGDGDATSGYTCTHELMRLKEPPTAIFCCTDRMAMGVYDALKELELSIPGDVAVVGFDNQEVIAAFLRPPLSTVALPHSEMGRWAVEQVLTGAETPVKRLIFCPFVSRESV